MVLAGELIADGGRAEDLSRITPRSRKRRGLTRLGVGRLRPPVAPRQALVDWLCEARLELLETVKLPAGACGTSRWPGAEGARLIEACGELGVEGIVMKRLGSVYRSVERCADWRKLKVQGWAAERMPRRSPSQVV
jgi:hypothetical protein